MKIICALHASDASVLSDHDHVKQTSLPQLTHSDPMGRKTAVEKFIGKIVTLSMLTKIFFMKI